MDFAGILSAIDVVALLAALGAIAALMMTVAVARWGYDQVLNFVEPSNAIDLIQGDWDGYEINMEPEPDNDYSDFEINMAPESDGDADEGTDWDHWKNRADIIRDVD